MTEKHLILNHLAADHMKWLEQKDGDPVKNLNYHKVVHRPKIAHCKLCENDYCGACWTAEDHERHHA